jgi:hypothetical protein
VLLEVRSITNQLQHARATGIVAHFGGARYADDRCKTGNDEPGAPVSLLSLSQNPDFNCFTMGSIQLRFENVSQFDANLHAQALLQHLKDAAPPEVNVERVRDDPQAMDGGSLLAIGIAVGAVGGKVFVEVMGKLCAEIIKDYISKRFPAKVRLGYGEQSIVIDQATPLSELRKFFSEIAAAEGGEKR